MRVAAASKRKKTKAFGCLSNEPDASESEKVGAKLEQD
jgi:hypothetical protein